MVSPLTEALIDGAPGGLQVCVDAVAVTELLLV
jgi:hypothetical protein